MQWIKDKKYYILFACLTFVFYQSSIDNEFSLDDKFIFANIPAEGTLFKDVFSVFAKRFDILDYRPVAMFTFALEQYFLGSINPKISHVINIVIYILLCLLIYYVLKKLPIKNANKIAIIATILFIVHPVHAGVVNNLKSRDGLFSMLFMFLAINAYVNYENTKAKKHIIFIILFSLIGINAKKDASNIVLILPMMAFVIYNRSIFKSAIILIGIFAIAGLSMLIVDTLIPYPELDKHTTVLFTENPLPYLPSIWNYLGLAVSTYFQYLKFIFIPKGYYFYFGYNQVPLRSLFHYITLLQLIIVLIPLLLSVYYYKKNKMFAFGIFFFYATLFYCSNLYTEVQGILADRYVFISSLGAFIAFSVILLEIFNFEKLNEWIQKQFWKKSDVKYIIASILVIIVLMYFPFVQQRNKAWQNILTLIETDMPYLTESYEANRIASTTYTNRAMSNTDVTQRENQFLKALQYAKQANKIYDKDIYTNETEGIAYYGLGKISEAEKQFKTIIQQFDTSVVSWDLLGDITFKRNNYDSAALCYANVNRLDKQNESFYYKYPNALHLSGKKDSAYLFILGLSKKYPSWHVPYESAAYLYFYNEGNQLKGMQFMVLAFEKGLRNKETYYSTLNTLEQGMQNQDPNLKEEYTSLYKKLKKIVIN